VRELIDILLDLFHGGGMEAVVVHVAEPAGILGASCRYLKDLHILLEEGTPEGAFRIMYGHSFRRIFWCEYGRVSRHAPVARGEDERLLECFDSE